ncbi:glycerophosphodiester phosphodiesterase [Colwelliaceae bacterium 6441]
MRIIAHRGASGEFPENSLLAFEQAIIQGADGIELDVHYHDESGQFIVIHDRFLDTTTNGQGHYNQYSLTELTQYTLGKNQQLITLEQALAFIAGRVFVNIEVKTSVSDSSVINNQLTALEKTLDSALINHHFSHQQFLLSSFNHHLIAVSKQFMPNVNTAALIAHNPIDKTSFAAKLHCNSVNQVIDCLDKAFIENAHKQGLEVWVYTVDRLEDIAFCQQLKVDAIFTNFPKRTRQRLNYCKDS